jgi:hypothetical protein
LSVSLFLFFSQKGKTVVYLFSWSKCQTVKKEKEKKNIIISKMVNDTKLQSQSVEKTKGKTSIWSQFLPHAF